MKTQILLGVLILIALTHAEPLNIASASTILDSQSSSLSGSLRGGKMIYLKGTGFDPVATNNQVFVGNFPCNVPA